MKKEVYGNSIEINEKLIVNISKNDISFSLDKGTIAFLTGKNGSGKTELLKEIFDICSSKKIGLFLNDSKVNLNDETVLLNLIRPLKNLNQKNPFEKVINILKELKLEYLTYKKVNELSYSQKKLVSFLKSIIHKPSVILIDDLFGSIDYEIKKTIINFLFKLKLEKNCIIIYTSNNKEDILFSDVTIVLNNCKLAHFCKTNDILNDAKKFDKLKIPMPFMMELSYKLKLYGLIDKLVLEPGKMVDELWK